MLDGRVRRQRPEILRHGGLLVASLLLFVVVGVVPPGPGQQFVVAVLAAATLVLAVVRDLRTTGQVRIEAVMGVLSLYILLGLFFGFLHGAIDNLGGEAFFAGGQEATAASTLYFSFTTLTTVGFGDFAARTDLGRTLSVSEALLGQIYLVTVVALIVGNLGRPARRRE